MRNITDQEGKKEFIYASADVKGKCLLPYGQALPHIRRRRQQSAVVCGDSRDSTYGHAHARLQV